MPEYFNDVTVPASWAPLVAAASFNNSTGTAPTDAVATGGSRGLIFRGTLTALSTNSAAIQIRGKRYPGVSSTLVGSLAEYLDYTTQPVDLSEIEVQGSGGTQVLKVQGWVD